MVKTLLTALFAVTIVLVFSTITFAQDKPPMDQKEKEVKGMMKETGMKMGDMGKSGLMSISCEPACGFRVTSHDQEELTSIIKMHAKSHHQKDLTDAEVKGMMKPAGKMGMRDKMMEQKKDESKPHE